MLKSNLVLLKDLEVGCLYMPFLVGVHPNILETIVFNSENHCMAFQVFQCKDKQCARFYHPKCVAEVLYPDSKSRALRFGNDVASGLEFHCPMHRCSLCKEAGNRDDKDMRLAVCGRCPTAYHRTCLPRFLPSLWRRCAYHPPLKN